MSNLSTSQQDLTCHGCGTTWGAEALMDQSTRHLVNIRGEVVTHCPMCQLRAQRRRLSPRGRAAAWNARGRRAADEEALERLR